MEPPPERYDDYYNEEELLNYKLDEIETRVSALIRKVMVFGDSKSFGLVHRTGTVDFPEEVLGSWLNAMSGKTKARIAFFQLDDENDELIQKKGKAEKASRTQKVKYSDINYVHVTIIEKPYAVQFHVETEKKSWVLRPIQDDDPDMVVHWVAALRYRANLFDDALLMEQQRALKAIVWFQSQYRKKKAMEKVQRRRDRRKGFINQAMGWLYGGYDDSDSDSDSEENKEDQVEEGQTWGFTSLLASIIEEAYATTFATTNEALDDEELKKQLEMDEETKRKFQLELSNSAALLNKNELRPLQANELEDEVWEHERWGIGGGWSHKTGNRSPFTDRIGRRGASDIKGSALKLPADWEVTQDWSVDLSGLNNAKCGKDGWVYQIDFGPLESDLAKGKYHIKAGPGYVVRRRRHYRRRALANGASPAKTTVLHHGWLGKKGLTTGRWTNRYFVMTNGMRIRGKITGVSLSYFRFSCDDHMKYIESQDPKIWEKLTIKDLKTYNLDGARVEMDKKKPGYFSVQLSNERRLKRVFNAQSEEAREIWIKWIKYAVSDQEKRFTLTRITMQKTLAQKKETSYDEINTLSWSILDSLVATNVDTFVHIAYFDTKFMINLNKALQCAKFEEKQPWTSRDGRKGSRREYTYILPRQKAKLANNLQRTRIIEKFKIEKHDTGVGIWVTKSLEFPDITYGKLFRCLVRTVVTKWKGERSRVCISMEVNCKSQDEGIKEYIESLMRKYLLQYYVDVWMPLITKAIRHFDKTALALNAKPIRIAGPNGAQYEVAEVSKYKKGKKKKEVDLKPVSGYSRIKEVI